MDWWQEAADLARDPLATLPKIQKMDDLGSVVGLRSLQERTVLLLDLDRFGKKAHAGTRLRNFKRMYMIPAEVAKIALEDKSCRCSVKDRRSLCIGLMLRTAIAEILCRFTVGTSSLAASFMTGAYGTMQHGGKRQRTPSVGLRSLQVGV